MRMVSPISTSPVSGFSILVIIFISVDFPHPFFPTKATASSRRKIYEKSFISVLPSNDLLMFLSSIVFFPMRVYTLDSCADSVLREAAACADASFISLKRSIRACCLVERAFAPLLIHSSSLLIMFCLFCSVESAIASLCALSSRKPS